MPTYKRLVAFDDVCLAGISGESFWLIMDEGSYKVRRRRRPYWILLLIPIGIGGFLLIRPRNSTYSSQHWTALDHKNESITLEDVLNGKFYAKGFNGSWVDSTKIQYLSSNGDFMTFSMETLTSTMVVSSLEFYALLQHRPFRCDFSPSKRFLLISYDPQKVFRHSVYALYSVLDLETRHLTHLSTDSSLSSLSRRIQLAKWSEKNDAIVFVHANDIYTSSIHGNVERISFDGNHFVFNGVTDWVYEEEMFNSNEAVWMLDDENLAFVTFNDSLVDLIQFPIYQGFQYPVLEAIPYPKSGRRNPTATVKIHSNKVTKNIQLPSYIPEDHYVGSVQWTDANLLVQILNRYQNNSWVLLCDLNGFCDVIHTTEQSLGWLDVKEIFQHESNYLTIESTKQNSLSYKHLVQFNKNSVVTVLSRGEFSVDKVLAVDGGGVYFMSNENLYKQSGHMTTCITCSFNCKSNQISMEKTSGRFFINVCLNGFEEVPRVDIYRVGEATALFTLELNTALQKISIPTRFPIVKRLNFLVSSFSVEMKLFLPHDFDESVKYPLLVDVYGGPGSSKLNDRFSVDWGVSLVSSKNIAYAFIDGRGSGGRNKSDEFSFALYKAFGTVEVEDQIAGVSHLLSSFSYLDPQKIAIWGWSYGGFVSAMVMGKDYENVFKCGISVAPVTNWAYYDTIYTERYLGVPMENPLVYNNSDITNYLDNFKKKKFFLVHGNADDNVHYQNSMYLSRALEMNDVLFRQQSYPDQDHGLPSVRAHLFHTLENFLFSSCF